MKMPVVRAFRERQNAERWGVFDVALTQLKLLARVPNSVKKVP
jgi:hypothetical protein